MLHPGGEAAKGTMSFDTHAAVNLKKWDIFVTHEHAGHATLHDKPEVKVIKLNPRRLSREEEQKQRRLVDLLLQGKEFPEDIHTIELVNCRADSVPEKVEGLGELRVLRLTLNNVRELPQHWLGSEARPRSRSEASDTSRTSAFSRFSLFSGWSRSRSLSPQGGVSRRARRGMRRRRAKSPPGEEREEQKGSSSGDSPHARVEPQGSPASHRAPNPTKSALRDVTSPGGGTRRRTTFALSKELESESPDSVAVDASRNPEQRSSPKAELSPKSVRSVQTSRSLFSRMFQRHRRGWARPRLEELTIDRNQLGYIERGALSGGIVKDLLILNLGNNVLADLPSDFLQGASSLRLLDLSKNQLHKMPMPDDFMDQECSLQILNLDNNRITSLPEKLPRGLRRLFVSYNLLADLPSDIGRCRNLETLRIAGNQIRELPPSIIKLWPGYGKGGKLVDFQVEENPLVHPSITAFQMGGIDAAFEMFNRWIHGKSEESDEELPAEAGPREHLPPRYAACLESVRFTGLVIKEGARRSCVARHSDGEEFSLFLREYAYDVVSIEAKGSVPGLVLTARGDNPEHRQVSFARARDGDEALCYFRARRSAGELVTLESIGFPGFFLNVYGSSDHHKLIQLVPEEPSSPRRHSWGFFKLHKVEVAREPLADGLKTKTSLMVETAPEDDEDRAVVLNGEYKRNFLPISPIKSFKGVIHGITSMKGSPTANATRIKSLVVSPVNSLRAVSPIRSMPGRASR
jgi:Leucine-rich repeat (LRR) protein